MDIAVPSRFSCLNIEDEDFKPTASKCSKKKEKKPNTVITNNKKLNKQVPIYNNQPKKKTKSKQDVKQWEEWKRKDSEMVNDHFEQDLQNAIMQSQLDYEQEKRNPAVLRISEVPQKKKKSKTMSLDQFLDQKTVNGNSEPEKQKDDKNFFDKINATVKQEITKESVKSKRREREGNIEERITLAQYQAKYEKEKAENDVLRKELEEARDEIALVKKRNSTLCSMLSQGEMKDKAAVLLELKKITLVKEELDEEVGKLHKLLEQERSKLGSIGDNHTKNKDKKHKKK